MRKIQLHSYEALEALVLKQGFLPFFKNNIRDFSVEEFTPSEHWFSAENDGAWEWKGPVALNGQCVYGKLFNNKAGFVSMDWFPDLLNYRRSVYKMTPDSGGKTDPDRAALIYNTVVEQESLLSKEIKKICGKESFDSILTRLQMGTWFIVADFEYQYDKHLKPYGWGIARYTTPEALYGEGILSISKHRTPEESKQRIIDHLTKLLPKATPSQILKIIG